MIVSKQFPNNTHISDINFILLLGGKYIDYHNAPLPTTSSLEFPNIYAPTKNISQDTKLERNTRDNTKSYFVNSAC